MTNRIGTAGSGMADLLRLPAFVLRGVVCASLVLSAMPMPAQMTAQAQTEAPAAGSTDDQPYTVEQLDALLAPIALYPDQLLTQVLLASVYPLQVVAAARWVQDPAHKSLTGDTLDQALAAEDWDPSVKSLVPFPQILSMMNDKLDWMQQVGYAMTVQQKDVMDSVQRLRAQAQQAGQLKSTEQQVVSTEGQTIVIAPAQPNVVYVPSYNPTVVYGAWPYPAYPPVYLPPPPGYAAGAAVIGFGVGVAVTASLWGWAQPNWGYGNVNVNVNRYNNINVNRPPIHNSNWQPHRPPNGGFRPPPGPVGRPGRPTGLPANSIGRPSVSVPGGIARPPAGMGPGNRPGGSGAVNRPGGAGQVNRPGGAGQVNRPGGLEPGNRPGGAGQVNRPGGGQGAGPGLGQGAGQGGNRPNFSGATRPGGGRAPGAFSGMGEGRSAAQFGSRGAQSQHFSGGGRAGGGSRGGGGRR